jgi:type IV secretion system protein VirB6/type IV secretion system protein TrbL
MKKIHWVLMTLGILLLVSEPALADLSNDGIMNEVLTRFDNAASGWATTLTTAASWLFWTLVTISMVWTFGFMALRKADIGEYFAELIRFTIFTGFFWWLLTNAVTGRNIAGTIITSLQKLGAQAGNLGSTKLDPGAIVDVGFSLFDRIILAVKMLGWQDFDIALVMMILGGIILTVLALIAVNMLLLLVTSWLVLYAGVFFLGFGGSRWTSEMAINYYRTVLGIAAQILTMILLVGIGKKFIEDFSQQISGSTTIQELAVMMVVSIILLVLTNKVPTTIAGIITGSSVGNTGIGQLGAGAAMGAAGMAAMAAGMAGSAAMGGLTSMAGGGSAIKAAYDKAQANMGGDGGGAMPSFGGSGSTMNDGGVSALASAMGDDSNGAMPSFGGSGSTMNGGKGSTSTIANLTQGAMDVARASFTERVGETTGGRIAAAIRASGQGTGTNTSSTFNDNSLSAGTSEPDPESEVAAFRDRNSQTS